VASSAATVQRPCSWHDPHLVAAKSGLQPEGRRPARGVARSGCRALRPV